MRGNVFLDGSFLYTGNGIDIADGNYSAAELINNKHLYVHSDLTHYGTKEENYILAGILDIVIDIVKNTSKEVSNAS